MIVITESDHDHALENIVEAASAAAASDDTAKADLILSYLRSLPPPPPPATPPPPLAKMITMKHGIASDGSLDSLETRTTSSSTSSCYDSEADTSGSDARLDVDDDDDVENSNDEPSWSLQEKQQQQQQASSKRRTTKLSWGTVQIREYNRTIGDHPEVTYGPPLTLDWQYHQHDDIDVVTYEESRTSRKQRHHILRLSSLTRRNLLANEFLIPLDELNRAEVQVEKMQRRRTQSQRQATWRNRLQQMRRGMGRFFSNREVLFAALAAASGGGPLHSFTTTGMMNNNSSSMSSMSM